AGTSRRSVTAVQAIWLTGATLVMMPLPARLGSLDQFISQTRARVRAADAAALVIEDELAGFFEPEPDDPPLIMLQELDRRPGGLLPGEYERPHVDPESLAMLQFTSGSTAEPKGVMLPHRCVST